MRSLGQGGEQSLLAGSLITLGTALARLERNEEALTSLRRGAEIAEQAGDPDTAGIASLTIVEELESVVPQPERRNYYLRAESMLSRSQHSGVLARLGECARKILTSETNPVDNKLQAGISIGNGHKHAAAAGLSSSAEPWADSTLEDLVLQFEGDLIRRALEVSKGSVTRAARLLGITHQGLAFIINGRHKSLLAIRTPVKTRRRSIIRYR